MDWHTPDAWTGYTWNRELFPDPEAFLALGSCSSGLYVTLNLHPAQGVQKHEAIYPQFAELLGQDPAQGEAIAFRPRRQSLHAALFRAAASPDGRTGRRFLVARLAAGRSRPTSKILTRCPG